jgi:hypothetical protein
MQMVRAYLRRLNHPHQGGRLWALVNPLETEESRLYISPQTRSDGRAHFNLSMSQLNIFELSYTLKPSALNASSEDAVDV